MSIESDVAGVLRGSPADRISYSLDQIAVDKGRMELVAKAIDQGDISVAITPTGNLLGAAYSSYKGRRLEPGQKKLIGEIALPNASVVNFPVGKAGIFHESIHALLDVKPSTISVRNGDEVLAYIGDAMYLKATNTRVGGDPLAKAIYDAAFAIIDGKKMLAKRGVALKWSDCGGLLDAINAHPAYR
jgi:hypothetical protein